MRAVLVPAVLLALSHPATAQPSLTPVASPPPAFGSAGEHVPSGYQTQEKPAEYKNPNTATLLALGASAVGVGGIALGYQMRDGGDTPIMMLGALVVVFGPSSGDWWASGGARFTPGLALRLAGASIMGLGLARAVDQSCIGDTCQVPLEDTQSNALLGIGAATVIGGMIYDIATAGRTAERHNASLRLAPQLVTTPRGTGAGFGISGAF